MNNHDSRSLNRRHFFRLAGAGSLGLSLSSLKINASEAKPADEKPSTNIPDALKYPRGKWSMPGLFPGKVVKVDCDHCVTNDEPDETAAYEMVGRAMTELTGKSSVKKAFRMFFNTRDRIGLKVNPVAGKSLATSHAVVKAVIRHLNESGIDNDRLLIWDRREFQLYECGFTPENYPGIRIAGTERKENDSFYGQDGRLLSEKMIDKNWFFHADVEGEYDEYTMPYMVNGGKYSYFTKLCTTEVDKIINIPIMKNAGASITMAMKNLSFGAIGNTGRLHSKLWAETVAQVCAFPPLRDKVVLNIADGIKGCFNGGPAANPQFFTFYRTVLASTDPVAIDRIAYDIILRKRIDEGLQKADVESAKQFMVLANALGLGECDPEKIDCRIVTV